MKVVSSLKSHKKRDLNSKLVRRRGRVYIINKKNPPKILIAASAIAANPSMLDNSKLICDVSSDAAIIAPTIITEEIALVTDIRGVCNEGVTLQTT